MSTERDASPAARDHAADSPEHEETIVCFLSGRRVPKDEAVQIKVGPGQRVWVAPEFFREG